MQVVNAKQDNVIWSESYDYKLGEVLAGERQIAAKVAAAVKGRGEGRGKGNRGWPPAGRGGGPRDGGSGGGGFTPGRPDPRRRGRTEVQGASLRSPAPPSARFSPTLPRT